MQLAGVTAAADESIDPAARKRRGPQVVSRLLARFDRAKRLTLYALLIEVLTLALTAALFLFAA